jgi:hypothetical protein
METLSEQFHNHAFDDQIRFFLKSKCCLECASPLFVKYNKVGPMNSDQLRSSILQNQWIAIILDAGRWRLHLSSLAP